MRRRILFVSVRLLSCLLVLTACEEEAMNASYDEDEIRELAYRALYQDLRIDTLDCTAMGVTIGDSLDDGLFWPVVTRSHPDAFLARLDDLPIRILHMHDLVDTTDAYGWGQGWRTTDTRELASACFTHTIQRIDATHLVIVCGMFFRNYRKAYAAFHIRYEDGDWVPASLQYYYKRMEGW
ncbi:MAG: hypothetical protein M5R41_08260 [Bacteroidia bacterium]|nr:hypothetical protein [Bacteroidia bacterium]